MLPLQLIYYSQELMIGQNIPSIKIFKVQNVSNLPPWLGNQGNDKFGVVKVLDFANLQRSGFSEVLQSDLYNSILKLISVPLGQIQKSKVQNNFKKIIVFCWFTVFLDPPYIKGICKMHRQFHQKLLFASEFPYEVQKIMNENSLHFLTFQTCKCQSSS